MVKNIKLRVNEIIFKIIKNILRRRGYDITHKDKQYYNNAEYPLDFSQQSKKIIKKVEKYTMTSPERVNALISSVNHIVV
tara:strand:- start:501 stop:740 length:240 start_codon:yes stop_codon:yes gene_type:complete